MVTDKNDTRHESSTGFLTVAEAAAALGVSRLRIRQAAAIGALTSRRDNEGMLRVDIPKSSRSRKTLDDKMQAQLPPTQLVEVLFDEVEEMHAVLDQRDGQIQARDDLLERQADALSAADEILSAQQTDIANLSDLAERQSAALDSADAALSLASERETALTGLLDNAMARLDTSSDAAVRLAGISDQAITNLEGISSDLEASLSQTARLEALLARAMIVTETQGDAKALGATTEQAFSLLEDAVTRAEAGQAASARTEEMLDRALAAGEHMQIEIARNKSVIKKQDENLETVLEMSERAVAAAARGTQPTHQSRTGLRAMLKRLLGV